MKRPNFNQKSKLLELISEYEAMSQKGTVGFFEEKVFFDFVNHYRACHNIEMALQVVEHGLSYHYFSADLYFCKAQLLTDLNQPKSAITCLNKASSLAPYDENIRRFLKKLLVEEEKKRTKEEEEDSSMEFSFGEMYISESEIDEQYQDVEELYNRLKAKLQINPTHELSLNKILFCVEINQRYQDSVDFHLELINNNAYSYLAWYNLGHAYACLKQYENAADAFEYSFIAKGSFTLAYKEFSKVCFKLNDYERALNAFQELLNKSEPDSSLLTSIGECYEMKEDYDVAYLFYNKALKIDPICAVAHYRIGECFTKQKKWKKAIRAYQEAIAISDRKEEYYAAMGEAYFQIDKPNKAFSSFERAADICPDIATYWIQLATFLIDTEQLDLAWEKLEEADMYVFNSPEIEYCKVACLYLMNEKKESKSRLMEALNTYYTKHELLFEYAPEIEEDMGFLALINIFNMN